MINRLRLRPGRAAVLTAAGLALIAGATIAQTLPPPPAIEWDKRRLEQLDRNVRRLERALTQRNAAGDPVIIEPDPEVIALQGRVDLMDQRLTDMEQTLRRVNADGERILQVADERGRQVQALQRQLAGAESRIKALEDAASRTVTGSAAGDLAAAIRLATTDKTLASDAYRNIIELYPEAPEAGEAGYRLADILAEQGDVRGAIQTYAGALRGWPRTSWAPEAALKLATLLDGENQKPQACGAIGEFSRRYAEGATAAQRTRAAQIRTRAQCVPPAAPAAGAAGAAAPSAAPPRVTTPRGGAG